jgi:hypothetical protein
MKPAPSTETPSIIADNLTPALSLTASDDFAVVALVGPEVVAVVTGLEAVFVVTGLEGLIVE